MRVFLLGLLMICQVALAEEDKETIENIVQNWTIGWKSCDSQLATEGFAEDIDWINAFGVQIKGRQGIKEFLDWVFSLENAKERENSEAITLIRFIRPDIALVYTDFHVEKQKYLSGESMSDRHGHMLRVMSKENHDWQIVSMMIMDEKPSAP